MTLPWSSRAGRSHRFGQESGGPFPGTGFVQPAGEQSRSVGEPLRRPKMVEVPSGDRKQQGFWLTGWLPPGPPPGPDAADTSPRKAHAVTFRCVQ